MQRPSVPLDQSRRRKRMHLPIHRNRGSNKDDENGNTPKKKQHSRRKQVPEQKLQSQLQTAISEDPPRRAPTMRDQEPEQATAKLPYRVQLGRDGVHPPPAAARRQQGQDSRSFVLHATENEKHYHPRHQRHHEQHPRAYAPPSPNNIARMVRHATYPSSHAHHTNQGWEYINHHHPQMDQRAFHSQQPPFHAPPPLAPHGYVISIKPVFYPNHLPPASSPPYGFLSEDDPRRIHHHHQGVAQQQQHGHHYHSAHGGPPNLEPPAFLTHDFYSPAHAYYPADIATETYAYQEEEPAPVPSTVTSITPNTTTSSDRTTSVRPEEQHSSNPNHFPDNEPSHRSGNFAEDHTASDSSNQLEYIHFDRQALPPPIALTTNTFHPPSWRGNCEAARPERRQQTEVDVSYQSTTGRRHATNIFLTAQANAEKNDRSDASSTQSNESSDLSEATSDVGNVVDHMVPLGQSAAPLLPMPAEDSDELAPHYLKRTHVPLAFDEDCNWLSELLCFVRCELVEIFRATSKEASSRTGIRSVKLGQVGIRCRFCAHRRSNERALRATGFPSSLDRIYQGMTMMLRDHFGTCEWIPPHFKDTFLHLKSQTCQGAAASKSYWVYSARKRGLLDSPDGIIVNHDPSSSLGPNAYQSCSSKSATPDSTGGDGSDTNSEMTKPPVYLVDPAVDSTLDIPQFLVVLMSQVQRVELEEQECRGNRLTLSSGIPGLGCLYCCEKGRRGMCRHFPSRRRTLAHKIHEMWDHIRRCPLCPREVRTHLAHLYREYDQQSQGKKRRVTFEEKFFLDGVWSKLAHTATTSTSTDCSSLQSKKK